MERRRAGFPDIFFYHRQSQCKNFTRSLMGQSINLSKIFVLFGVFSLLKIGLWAPARAVAGYFPK